MSLNDDFLRCLEEADVAGIRRLWAQVQPNLPQPKNDAEALATLHMARTSSISVTFRLRAYSHRWLIDNGLPSLLPDNLKPRAERTYPRVVPAVGISVGTRTPELRPVFQQVQRSMEDAVRDCYANGDTDPQLIRGRMMEARRGTLKELLD